MRKVLLTSLKLGALLLLLLLLPASSRAQYVVVGQGCGASGINAIANNGVPVVCAGNPLVWTAVGGGGGGGGLNSFGVTFGDSATGAALTTAEVRYFRVPFACTIKAWSITADAGTATIKFARVNGGTALPTIGSNSISTSGVSLASGTAIYSTVVTDFTSTTLAPGDWIGVFVTTVATAKQIQVQLDCQ